METSRQPATPSSRAVPSFRLISEIELKLTPFDQREYLQLIEARGETLRRVASKLAPSLHLETAVDAGCGVGFFAQTLQECGLNVCGFDGRIENVTEARKRFPGIPFEVADVQDAAIRALGKFDLVLCFGLLYHLENPFAAIRNLRAMTGKCLVLESMCLTDERPSMVLREEPRQDDQSLTDVACYASESSLIKMLYRSGFSHVYRVVPLPNHEDFRETSKHSRRRTVLLASSIAVDVSGFRLCTETRDGDDPWAKSASSTNSYFRRAIHFLKSPTRTKYLRVANRLRASLPGIALPLRLPFGAWWLAERSALDHELLFSDFEPAEMRFVEKLLQPGMTVVDVGAHHGLYTLLSSKRVGAQGRVVAFEPSERECRRLRRHLRINRCRNVSVQTCALGGVNGVADLFVVDGPHDWCNSLRPPDITDPTRSTKVPVRRLDDALAEMKIAKVDFIKLDVEGGELSFLMGATGLLAGDSRPAILAEVQDVRTLPWGYQAREIVNFLNDLNYVWFALGPDGSLVSTSCHENNYDANLVALPIERLVEFQKLLDREASSASTVFADEMEGEFVAAEVEESLSPPAWLLNNQYKCWYPSNGEASATSNLAPAPERSANWFSRLQPPMAWWKKGVSADESSGNR